MHRRPAADEHVAYFQKYIALVPDGDIVGALASQMPVTVELLSGLSDAQANFRYAPGKWSVKEVVGHMLDSERVFTYRALAAARGEPAPLPSFDQDLYVANAGFESRSLASILEALTAVRAATVALFASFDEAAMSRRVIASGNPVTARALAWITAGHELHHRRDLREKYLQGV
jgi:uncharacterized damage-inducible protein DinB